MQDKKQKTIDCLPRIVSITSAEDKAIYVYPLKCMNKQTWLFRLETVNHRKIIKKVNNSR